MKKEHAMKNINKRERKNFSIVFTIALVFLLTAAIIPGVMGASAVGASAVDLGSACNFAILAKSGITTTGTTLITGNIGVSPIAATGMTGFGLIMDPTTHQFSTSSLVVGKVYAPLSGPDYLDPTSAMLTTAVGDMETAYNTALLVAADATELYDGDLGGRTLAPGVYKWSSGVLIPTDVTLSGSSTDVWIFQIAGNLDISSDKQVILSPGAQPSNIFWVVAGTTTLNTGSVFNGNILGGPDTTTIALNTGATLNGRALAQKDVTLQANTVNGPTTCAIPVPEIPVPEFPTVAVPVVMLIGIVFIFHSIRRKE